MCCRMCGCCWLMCLNGLLSCVGMCVKVWILMKDCVCLWNVVCWCFVGFRWIGGVLV